MVCSNLLRVFLASVVLLAVFAPGCASTPPATETITVEGTVQDVGNAPFGVEMLETETGNSYILDVPDSLREGFRTYVPLRVTGTLYRANWNGRPHAHLRVTAWKRVDR